MLNCGLWLVFVPTVPFVNVMALPGPAPSHCEQEDPAPNGALPRELCQLFMSPGESLGWELELLG